MKRRTITTAGALALGAGLLVAPLSADNFKRPSFEVIASGLDNPRGIAIGPDKAIYVAEAGRGGSGKSFVNGAGATVCFGYSGAITKITDDRVRRIIDQIPSVAACPNSAAPGTQAEGPNDILFDRWGRGVATIGLGGDPDKRPTLGRDGKYLGRLFRFTDRSGRFAENIGQHEADNNPAGGTVDSNPFKITTLDGSLIVADAGGNSVIQVDDGVMTTFATFENKLTPGPTGALIPMQPVPTSVAEGPDGALYVGQLTGFPFPPKGAVVFRVTKGGTPEVFADGFTNIIDIEFDRRGNLYVLEVYHNGLLTGNPVGALIKVSRDGTREELFPGALIAPGGMTIARDGSIYVTRFATMPSVGDVVRITP